MFSFRKAISTFSRNDWSRPNVWFKLNLSLSLLQSSSSVTMASSSWCPCHVYVAGSCPCALKGKGKGKGKGGKGKGKDGDDEVVEVEGPPPPPPVFFLTVFPPPPPGPPWSPGFRGDRASVVTGWPPAAGPPRVTHEGPETPEAWVARSKPKSFRCLDLWVRHLRDCGLIRHQCQFACNVIEFASPLLDL